MKVISLLVVSFSGFFADIVFELSWALAILPYVNIAVRCYFASSLYAPFQWKLQHPPPGANLEHFTTVCARGAGKLLGKAFSEVGNLIFAT